MPPKRKPSAGPRVAGTRVDRSARTLTRPRPQPRRAAETKGEGLADRYPNLAALRALEHAEHVRRAMQMGLTRKQAELHARRDERDARVREGDRFWADSRPDARALDL